MDSRVRICPFWSGRLNSGTCSPTCGPRDATSIGVRDCISIGVRDCSKNDPTPNNMTANAIPRAARLPCWLMMIASYHHPLPCTRQEISTRKTTQRQMSSPYGIRILSASKPQSRPHSRSGYQRELKAQRGAQ